MNRESKLNFIGSVADATEEIRVLNERLKPLDPCLPVSKVSAAVREIIAIRSIQYQLVNQIILPRYRARVLELVEDTK